MKLSQIKGLLPEKKKRGKGFNAEIKGWNDCLDSLAEIEIEAQWKKVRQAISKANNAWYKSDKTEPLEDFVAKALCLALPGLVRVH